MSDRIIEVLNPEILENCEDNYWISVERTMESKDGNHYTSYISIDNHNLEIFVQDLMEVKGYDKKELDTIIELSRRVAERDRREEWERQDT